MIDEETRLREKNVFFSNYVEDGWIFWADISY
jgi:hypothetical protein